LPICSKSGGDAALGIVVAVTLFNAQTPTSYLLALGGARAGILPDALQFAYVHFPHQPLTSIQRFHEWISHNPSDVKATGAWNNFSDCPHHRLHTCRTNESKNGKRAQLHCTMVDARGRYAALHVIAHSA
jgi:hypothetical protein